MSDAYDSLPPDSGQAGQDRGPKSSALAVLLCVTPPSSGRERVDVSKDQAASACFL